MKSATVYIYLYDINEQKMKLLGKDRGVCLKIT